MSTAQFQIGDIIKFKTLIVGEFVNDELANTGFCYKVVGVDEKAQTIKIRHTYGFDEPGNTFDGRYSGVSDAFLVSYSMDRFEKDVRKRKYVGDSILRVNQKTSLIPKGSKQQYEVGVKKQRCVVS